MLAVVQMDPPDLNLGVLNTSRRVAIRFDEFRYAVED